MQACKHMQAVCFGTVSPCWSLQTPHGSISWSTGMHLRSVMRGHMQQECLSDPKWNLGANPGSWKSRPLVPKNIVKRTYQKPKNIRPQVTKDRKKHDSLTDTACPFTPKRKRPCKKWPRNTFQKHMLNLTQSDMHWAAPIERRLALTERFQNA